MRRIKWKRTGEKEMGWFDPLGDYQEAFLEAKKILASYNLV
jgi:hypothetical protein